MKERIMKSHHLIVVGIVLLGSGYWLGKSQTQHLAVVDSQKLVLQTAEGIARKTVSPEQATLKMIKFKENLQSSLKAFAQKNNLLIVPSHSLFGDVVDKTEAFIAFYNEDSNEEMAS